MVAPIASTTMDAANVRHKAAGSILVVVAATAAAFSMVSCRTSCTRGPEPQTAVDAGSVDTASATGGNAAPVLEAARIVPRVKPAFVSAKVYPPVSRQRLSEMGLNQVTKLAGECRDLLRQGCLAVFERGVELTKDDPGHKAEHVQFLFDLANEFVRVTLWEDGQLAEDRFALEDSKAPAGRKRSFAGIDRADEIYREIMEFYPGSPWEAQAALERALMYSNALSGKWGREHARKARLLLARVIRDYAKTPQSALAVEELKRLGRTRGE